MKAPPKPMNGKPTEQALSEAQNSLITVMNQLIDGVKKGEILAFGAVCVHGHGLTATSLSGTMDPEFFYELIGGAGNMEAYYRAALTATLQQRAQQLQSKIVRPPAGWTPPPVSGKIIIE